jgi:hypothetical protein
MHNYPRVFSRKMYLFSSIKIGMKASRASIFLYQAAIAHVIQYPSVQDHRR